MTDGKEALLAAVTEVIEMLPLDFEIIDPDNPIMIISLDSTKNEEEVVGDITRNQKILLAASEQLFTKLTLPSVEASEAARLIDAMEVLRSLLFISASNTLKLYERDLPVRVGVREDCKIVKLPFAKQ